MKRLIALVLLLFHTSLAFGGLSPDLTNLPLPNTVEVIIQYRQSPTQLDLLKVTGLGGVLKTQLPLINGAVVSLSPSALLTLVLDPSIRYISPNRRVEGTLDYATSAANVKTAWQAGKYGTGVGVAVIDSGIASHPDLQYSSSTKSRVVYSQSFNGSGTVDEYGHGTHVAGIIAGNGKASSKLYAGWRQMPTCSVCGFLTRRVRQMIVT